MRRGRALVVVAVLAVFGAACAQGDQATLSIGTVPDEVDGNVLTLPVTVEGIEIVKADGDTSGDSGHFHVFIDKDPVAEGETIEKEAGIVHSAENPIFLTGLAVGQHELTVVLGDGTHKRIGDVEDSVTIDVKGPSVDISGPATLKAGEDLTVDLKAEGVEIAPADGKRGKESGHFHVLVDEDPPDEGVAVPAPVENKIIHTTEESVTVSGLAKGEHTIWLVLGDGQHYPWGPPVLDKLTVTVS